MLSFRKEFRLNSKDRRFGESSIMAFIQIHHDHYYGAMKKDLTVINDKLNKIMANLQEFKDLFAAQAEAIKNIDADLKGLIATITSNGINAVEETELLAILQKQTETLTALAAIVPDPAPAPDPIPTEPQ